MRIKRVRDRRRGRLDPLRHRCPGPEVIIEVVAGNHVGVRQAYDELAQLLEELMDGYEPSDLTQHLLQQLTARRLSA